jgi:hypothetical protein
MALLEAIVTQETQEPPQLPRLTSSDVFLNYCRIGTFLTQSAKAHQELLEAPPKRASELLLQIAQNGEQITKWAMRLLEANR